MASAWESTARHERGPPNDPSQHIQPALPPLPQGDGTAHLLCRDASEQAAVCSILQADFPAMTCLPFTVPATGSNGTLQHSSSAAAAGLCSDGSPIGKAAEAVAVAAQ